MVLVFRAMLFSMAFVSLAGCTTPTSSESGVYHIVMLWLKPGTTDSTQQQIISQTRALESIPSLKRVSVGKVLPSTRTIVDDSFDIGIVMVFNNQADMNAYLQHPRHSQLVKTLIKPNIQKIRVHDFIL